MSEQTKERAFEVHVEDFHIDLVAEPDRVAIRWHTSPKKLPLSRL